MTQSSNQGRIGPEERKPDELSGRGDDGGSQSSASQPDSADHPATKLNKQGSGRIESPDGQPRQRDDNKDDLGNEITSTSDTDNDLSRSGRSTK